MATTGESPIAPERQFTRRSLLLIGVQAAGFILIAWQLFSLQVLTPASTCDHTPSDPKRPAALSSSSDASLPTCSVLQRRLERRQRAYQDQQRAR
jgi:hypothetical protein